jgi:hypothetical protein
MVAVAQWLEHQVVVLGVGGSSPLGHPSFSHHSGRGNALAILTWALSSVRLERQTLNLRVTGSNPVGPTRKRQVNANNSPHRKLSPAMFGANRGRIVAQALFYACCSSDFGVSTTDRDRLDHRFRRRSSSVCARANSVTTSHPISAALAGSVSFAKARQVGRSSRPVAPSAL